MRLSLTHRPRWWRARHHYLPLVSPSIRAAVDQTITLRLAMVFVTSLIGAKRLGEDVLQALLYANDGLGVLVGFAIFFV